jgi:predicted DNA-binding helix-hairpin-helix protein
MNTEQKLSILADASRYDLSCACGTSDNADHRRRGANGMWLYPVSLPNGGVSIMLKTLLSNACVNDCRYCPFRAGRDQRRCTMAPDEIARTFLDYSRRLNLHGLFLSSGVVRSPDHTMGQLTAVAELLRRRHQYRGYLHLKVIPGASDAAVEAAVNLASAVSLNVEAPTRSAFGQLCGAKDFDRDILRPLHLISRLTAKGMPRGRVKATTQFLVGAVNESDAELVTATGRLYYHLGLQRVYFSAYQRGAGDPDLPGERRSPGEAAALLTREHRLYQVDWLLRKYHFRPEEIPFDAHGSLALTIDPKSLWAQHHPEYFPVDVNAADRWQLLRVPGLGPTAVERILAARGEGRRLRQIEDLGRPNMHLRRAESYLAFA